MFQILTVTGRPEIIITNDRQALSLANHRELLQLRNRIEAYLQTLQPDDEIEAPPQIPDPSEMLNTVEAQQIAEQAGYNLPGTTLRTAAEAGAIPGSAKAGGRWEFPRSAFERWLHRWAAKQRS